MAATMEKFKSYLRLPPDSAEDVSGYLAAAKSKARTAGIPDFQNNAQYDGFIYALGAMLYDNRGLSFQGTYQQAAEENARRFVNSYVLELRYAEEDEPL
jgi:hypothetical protein